MRALPLCIALYADGLLCGTLDQLYPLFLVPHCSLQRALSLSLPLPPSLPLSLGRSALLMRFTVK